MKDILTWSYTKRNYHDYYSLIRTGFSHREKIDYWYYDKHGGIQAKESFDNQMVQDKYLTRFVDRYDKNGFKIGFSLDDNKYHLVNNSNYYYDNVNKVYYKRQG